MTTTAFTCDEEDELAINFRDDGVVGPLDILSDEEASQLQSEFEEWMNSLHKVKTGRCNERSKTNLQVICSGNVRFKPHLHLSFTIALFDTQSWSMLFNEFWEVVAFFVGRRISSSKILKQKVALLHTKMRRTPDYFLLIRFSLLGWHSLTTLVCRKPAWCFGKARTKRGNFPIILTLLPTNWKTTRRRQMKRI
jgi:hypothetical protein